MLRPWLVVCGCAALVIATAPVIPDRTRGAPPPAQAAACAALGAADRFAVFSDGVFTAAHGGGTTIVGRTSPVRRSAA